MTFSLLQTGMRRSCIIPDRIIGPEPGDQRVVVDVFLLLFSSFVDHRDMLHGCWTQPAPPQKRMLAIFNMIFIHFWAFSVYFYLSTSLSRSDSFASTMSFLCTLLSLLWDGRLKKFSPLLSVSMRSTRLSNHLTTLTTFKSSDTLSAPLLYFSVGSVSFVHSWSYLCDQRKCNARNRCMISVLSPCDFK